jgi:transcriptional regulator with XRE-family HTH domain
MRYKLEPIAHALKEARAYKGLSQRELSQRSGVPQGQISKIERGTVDLRASSLIALSRALDLELSLVPRKSLSAVQAIIRSSGLGRRRDDVGEVRPAYVLDEDDDA